MEYIPFRDGSNQRKNAKRSWKGSGVIYKKEGDKAYIVTNNHVVEGAKHLK